MTTSDQLRQLALIASNQDLAIADLLQQVFEHETLTMDSISIGGSNQAYQDKPSLEFIEGYSFEAGFLSPYFLQAEESQSGSKN